MPAPKMHADEPDLDVPFVRRLIEAQLPAWADLPIARVASSGTDNALFRLGDDMVVRMPRIGWAVDDVAKEQQWLPRLAPVLPLPVPLPLAVGEPAEHYLWRWSIYRWLAGQNPVVGAVADAPLLARDLAAFVVALHAADATGGPPASRGVPLVARDDPTRAAIAALEGLIDPAAATAAWDEALRAPLWNGPPVWVHGDLAPGNLLLRDGCLAAVIDFGSCGVGDPACDLIAAWNLLPAAARDVYREALGVDDATWARGRGWALSVALIQLPYYKDTNPALAASSRHVLGELLRGGPGDG